jgi:hypothetical protein
MGNGLLIEWAQKGMHHDGKVVWQLDGVKQLYTTVSGIYVEGIGGEKPIDLKLVSALLLTCLFNITGLRSEIHVATMHKRN